MDIYRAFLKKQVRNYMFGSLIAVIASGSMLMLTTLDLEPYEYRRLLIILAVSFLVMAAAELTAFIAHLRPTVGALREGNPDLELLEKAYRHTHKLPLLSVRRIMGPHLLGLSIPGASLAVWMISAGMLQMPYYYVALAVLGAVLIAAMHALIEFFLTGPAIVPLITEIQDIAYRKYGTDLSKEEHTLVSIRPKFLISCMLIGTFPLLLFSIMTQIRLRSLSPELTRDYWVWAGMVLLLGVGFSTIAAWLLTRSVQQPIRHLYEAMNEIKEGRLVPAQDPYSDEFSSLVAGFNMMVEAIETREGQNRQLLDSLFTSLAVALDARDPYTAGHSLRVAEYSVIIGRLAGMGGEQLDNLRKSALLHDIGKIGVRDSVLFKEGKLTDEEFDQIKSHPVLGENILRQIEPPDKMAPYLGGVRSHHERYDGKGYPDSLGGLSIPLHGRIIAVADAYDAMTSDRPYRKGMDHERALSILEAGRGTQWDPYFTTLFLSYFGKSFGNRETGYAGITG